MLPLKSMNAEPPASQSCLRTFDSCSSKSPLFPLSLLTWKTITLKDGQRCASAQLMGTLSWSAPLIQASRLLHTGNWRSKKQSYNSTFNSYSHGNDTAELASNTDLLPAQSSSRRMLATSRRTKDTFATTSYPALD